MKNTFSFHILAFTLFLTIFASGIKAQPAYDYSKLKREKLNRGVVAIKKDEHTNFISWRYLSSDPIDIAFNVYRDGKKVNDKPVTQSTCFEDKITSTKAVIYTVKPVIQGKETKDEGQTSWKMQANAPRGYINIPIDLPADGVTLTGETYTYSPNDASIGDVDGDGEYEIILKFDPSNARDNAHDGYTGNVFFDCYKLNGKKLWRIDMGKNIRAGAHYTQFMVYDLDGDGKAEIVMKTADGTIDGSGKVIGDPSADYREKGDSSKPRGGDFPPGDPRGNASESYPPRNQGRILTGPEYLTVFNGETGGAMQTIDYYPPRGNSMDWGDDRGNRSERYLACIAYLDGEYPSVVMCRGYYTRAVLAAYDWRNGKLTQRWVFDTKIPGNERYRGQGNHNLRVGDIDGDGCDEIIYGACAIDHDGKGLYTTGLGHGDALHLTVFDPAHKDMQVWDCHENRRDGSTFTDAATGKIIFQIPSNTDVGRCMAADIDPNYPGVEMWSSDSKGIRNIKGECIDSVTKISINMACWWDGDLIRELLDKNQITKYDYINGGVKTLLTAEGCISNNGTKSTPCIQGDIIGDWREEVLFRTEDNKNLRLYVSTYPTDYRFHSFAEEPVYRISMATQNVAYNQPTQPGFYFGPDLEKSFSGVFRGYEFKAKEKINDFTAPLHLLTPDYKIPYREVTEDDIKLLLDRVWEYLDESTPAKVIDKETKAEITDYSKIDRNSQLQQGTFRLASYEWGVTYSGMLAIAEATGDKKYHSYVYDRFKFLATVAPAFRKLMNDDHVIDPQMRQILDPHALDDAGAMCASMIKLQQEKPDFNLREMIDNYMNYIMNKEYRLSDGTFARNRPQHNTVWLDDMYMSIPAIVQMGKLTGEVKYFDEATRQVKQFTERMFVPEKGLFRHGWVESMQQHPAFFWGRANGWAILTLTEVLDVLPENHPDRQNIMKLLQAHIQGLASCQSGEGFWHQLLDRNDSYLETSAAAIYVYCIAHAINKGWIDPLAYGPVAQLGWNAVTSKINDKGQVEGTCVGTGMAFDPAFYYYRPVNVYAAHGYGPVLLAGAEMIKLLKNFYPRMNDSAIQYYASPQTSKAPIFSVDN